MPDTAAFVQTYYVQFDFHFDETQRLLELARALPDDVYRTNIDYSHGSPHDTFVHLRNASHLWRRVIANEEPSFIEVGDVADIDALVPLFDAERAGWRELLTTLNDAALLETLERWSPDGMMRLALWQALQHVILHGLVHHSELARILSDAGLSPGDIDFLEHQGVL